MPGEIKSSVTAFRQATGSSGRTSMLRVCCDCVEGKVCVLVVKTCWKSGRQCRRWREEGGGRLRTSLKAPSWILKRPLAASSSATSLQTSVMCLFALGKDSVRISIKSSVVSLMALSMEGQPIPLYTSAQLCVNHPSLILPFPSSSLSRLPSSSAWTHSLSVPPLLPLPLCLSSSR